MTPKNNNDDNENDNTTTTTSNKLPKPLSKLTTKQETLETLRQKTKKILTSLSTTATTTNQPISNWLNPSTLLLPQTSTPQCRHFHQNGFLHLEQFCTPHEITEMKIQMKTLVEERWHPGNDDDGGKTAAFRTDEKQMTTQSNNDYFLDSAARIHFFAEVDALDEDTGRLKEDYEGDKMTALNKSGHGLHVVPGAFHSYTTSDKIGSLVESLGYVDPVVPQSMYIFKQARIGGVVTSHQDSTFLYTTPRQTCLGLWLALDDATVENGCLWIRPKSHRESVRRRFSRNEEYFSLTPNKSAPKMLMETSSNDKNVPWDGALPSDDDDGNDGSPDRDPITTLQKAGFVPVECNAGDLVVFPGELDHLSLPNRSDKARHTFQLHLVEGRGGGVEWARSNWLQYPEGMEFLSLKKRG